MTTLDLTLDAVPATSSGANHGVSFAIT